MIFLASIYYGAMYGGAISSITLGIPGASTAVATTFDGRPLALAGRAHVALVVALASFAGATVSNSFFIWFCAITCDVVPHLVTHFCADAPCFCHFCWSG